MDKYKSRDEGVDECWSSCLVDCIALWGSWILVMELYKTSPPGRCKLPPSLSDSDRFPHTACRHTNIPINNEHAVLDSSGGRKPMMRIHDVPVLLSIKAAACVHGTQHFYDFNMHNTVKVSVLKDNLIHREIVSYLNVDFPTKVNLFV